MTADELINLLMDVPGDTPVLVDGYEDGYDDPRMEEIFVVDLGAEHKEDVWCAGRYGDDGDGFTFRAVVLRR